MKHHRKTVLKACAAMAFSLLTVLEACACEPAFPRRVVDRLINVENQHAAAALAEWQKRQPQDPRSGFYEVVLQWAQVEAEWDGEKRKALAQEVSRRSEAYVVRLRSDLADHPHDARLRLDIGLGEALAGRAAMTAGQWFRAYRFGRAGRDTLRALIEDDPTQTDALYVLGLYEFYTGSVPYYLRWLTALLDLSGDAQQGIAHLERATREAPTVAPEAARALLTQAMWSRPERCRYWPLAQQMRSRYPGNPEFAIQRAALASECGHPREGLEDLATARTQFRHEPRLTPWFNQLELPLREAAGDVAWFEREPSPWTPDRWQLGRARAFDVAGDRAQAERLYQAVQADSDAAQAIRSAAERGAALPFTPPPPQAGESGLTMSGCENQKDTDQP